MKIRLWLFFWLFMSLSLVYAKTDTTASLGVAMDGYPIDKEKLDAISKEIGFHPKWVVFYLQWPEQSSSSGFPEETLDAITNYGAIPVLTWEPMYYRAGEEKMISGRMILDGDYNSYIDYFASQARDWGIPLVIRFAHEMNISRYHWGTSDKEYGPSSPELYRQLFRYLVKRFRQIGADNVQWAFVPNVDSIPNQPWNRIEHYYPGDDVVSLLGMDGYNWGTARTKELHGWKSEWRSFKSIFEPLYQQLRALTPQRPIIVFETASALQGGNKMDWFSEALKTAQEWNLRGFVWFQVNKEIDWRLSLR